MKSISNFRLSKCQHKIEGPKETLFIFTNNLFIHRYVINNNEITNQIVYPLSYEIESIKTGNIQKVI